MLVKLPEELERLDINVVVEKEKSLLLAMEVWPTLTEEIQAAQEINPQLVRMKIEVLEGKALGFVIHEDGMLWFYNWVCVPKVDAPRRQIIDEGHNMLHAVHPDGNKLYKGLNQSYWWSNMK